MKSRMALVVGVGRGLGEGCAVALDSGREKVGIAGRRLATESQAPEETIGRRCLGRYVKVCGAVALLLDDW